MADLRKIISSRNDSRGGFRAGGMNSRLGRSTQQASNKSTSPLKNRLQLGTKTQFQDARQKLLAKKSKITDAREKLNQKKIVDARTRLTQMRELKKKKEAATSYRTKQPSASLQRNVQNLKTTQRATARPQQAARSPNKQLIMGTSGRLTVIAKNDRPRQPQLQPRLIYDDDDLETMTLDDLNDLSPGYLPSLFPTTTVTVRPRVATEKLSAEMRNRLSPAAASVSPIQGFKVLIMNLHPKVTEQDIIELFGNIGALKRARLLGAGTAEVVFSKSEDALSAVETYHNRDLDGKPMVCKVVTPIPAPNVASNMQSARLSGGITTGKMRSDQIQVQRRTAVALAAAKQDPRRGKLNPDSSSIYRALFAATRQQFPTFPSNSRAVYRVND